MLIWEVFGYLALGLAAAFVAALTLTVLFGAPYLPTRRDHAQVAVNLAGLQPGQTLVDLGCGDGRLLVMAARQGFRAVGYEINPFLALISWWRGRAFPGRVKVYWGNFWRRNLPAETAAVFVFAAGPYLSRLGRYLSRQAGQTEQGLVLISYAFALPAHRPIKRHGPFWVYKIPGRPK